ncbi:4'-phosphopantetheinyl transferase family protein [Advenella mimigardefordensis]|uniref:Putative 4'-phosphopantetheinyl transferase n=1 Tax=Advenella mimigardefordensis (strain DSM 17166 / LMG 22922 / DPN7) TaxID=1247726 RepID=W0PJA1_ADVMD|nr:4'-phosphopantetheinyl transferase superfamily protein [Advenella mimigardefordensis]AHG66102.1 putative 4'-phosphopantetheinyl transferase [Advenella mimigardefordensis DPN7]
MPSPVSDRSALLQLWFAGPALQVEYDPLALTPEDRAREAARLSARKAYEWRVSRALKRRLLEPYRSSSLSHSAGHALWAASSLHEHIGVDLERIRAIDELALSELIAQDDEMRLLRALQGQDRTRFFFRLWTLKEALVKAVGGDFPADMLRVGIRPCPCNTPAADGVISAVKGALPEDVDRALYAALPGAAQAAHVAASATQPQAWCLAGLGNRRWHGLSALMGDNWMMAVVWPAQDLSMPVKIIARQATPGEARVLPLAQSVVFGVGAQPEA